MFHGTGKRFSACNQCYIEMHYSLCQFVVHGHGSTLVQIIFRSAVKSSLYVCVLTRMSQIITAASRDMYSCMHRPTDELGLQTKPTSV